MTDLIQGLPIYAVAAALAVFVLLLAAGRSKRAANARLRRRIRRGEFLHCTEFENNWIVKDAPVPTGYKYNDFSGCYVIMIFDKPVHGRRFTHYENIYIGQSVTVCARVHNHFSGKGNGDVYADIKYGKQVYVRIVPCKAKRLNDMETALIEAFGATESYNKTKGGAKLTKVKK